MSQPPPPYERSFSFTDHSVNTPDLQQPGQKIDQELNNVLSTVNQTVSRLGEIQADDGKLRESAINGSTILQTAKNDAISAVNAAGTTNVAAVNAAGTTNVSAVTTAGQVAITAKNQAVASAAAAAVSAADANTQREMAQAARNDTFDSAAEVAAAEDNMIALAAGFTASANAALATANDAIQDAQDAITQAQEQVTLAAGHANDASQSAGTAAMSSSNAQYYAGVSQASAGEASTYKNQAQSFSSLASSSSITAVNASNASASHAGQAAASALAAADSAVESANSAVSSATSAANAANSLTDINTGLLSRLTNTINWTGEYNNGVTYQAGDGVLYAGEYFVLKSFIGAAGYTPGSYPGSWTKLIPASVSNLFDQTLNTFNSVQFDSLYAPNYVAAGTLSSVNGPVSVYGGGADTLYGWDYISFGINYGVNVLTPTRLTLGSVMVDAADGVTFPDSTVQNTAGIPLPAVAGLDGQVLSTDGVNPVWIDNSARTLFSAVRNETGATLTKGTVVYINGASGNKATVAKAQADADATSATTFAVLSADIANNNNGTAIVVGELTGLDTSAYAEGAALYLSPTVAGGFTTTKPSAPNHIVYVATVTRSHANHGIIEVRIQNGYELDELHNVQAQAPVNGDGIFFDSSDSQWKTAQPVSKVPSASTSTAGKVQLATEAEAIAGTDASKAVTPSTAAKEMARRFARRRFQTLLTTLATQVSGTGAAYAQVNLYTNIISPNITTAGFSRSYCIGAFTPDNFSNGDWAKPIGFGCTTSFSNHSSLSGHAVRCGLGYTSGPTAGVVVGDLTVRGFGFYWTQGGNVFLQVHDGTTLRNIDTGFTPTSAFGKRSVTYLEAFSDGNGNVTAYIRAYVSGEYPVSYTEYTASSANGPTGALVVSPNNGYLFQASTGTTHTATANYGGMHPTFFCD